MRLPPFLARTTLALGMALAGAAQAELPAEELGQVTLPFPPEPHRAYVVDVEFENMIATRVTVIDPDNKRMLGMLSTGGMAPMVPSRDQKRLYTADTYWSRYVRGTRTDMLTAWDSSTLSPLWEVEIPPKRANSITERYALTTSSDDRFVYIYNFTPSTSVTVVDVQARKAVNEIAISGCILNYPVGARRFASLCGDGSLQVLTLDDNGKEVSRHQTPMFDPNQVKMVERAVAKGDTYYFTTTEGVVHPVDLSGDKPKFLPTWSLVSEDEKKAGWAPGGWQMMALAPQLDRLYVLMHPDHQPLMWEDPSTIVWVYDLKTRKKIGTLEAPGLMWSLHATSDANPLLLGTTVTGDMEVFDLKSGKHTGTVEKVAKTPTLIQSH
ncbi:amine dehydrogenase large subunit [Geopseudomonas guangdongensis]|uniref:Methylamine dehydrogenase heavy chain n=1 Tax=Geopseudomonas guangdongensis TaxID=1245526 RepID=A0A1H2EX98_9GAMM|nr:amine dehydrogenase large subunit [Pseudomonas guangdongensis]SDT99760.1 methylamine dehydrogenase heavy chain [Pseudomonas guangdongensis]